ncbi:UDP-3-O-[3-hydroxymyristoyl] N-acetylglucosamine deacetylase [Candidatus Aerophobetes bacterium]|uniref:UDP-3-O-acyl-N-acetylglucosamine deacetylase n=1 Tax=Aerophobetes bacterium TaxID=2030807 RepID=A0A2A4YMX5_UNCAE|nr:MAG: UDP-3-O-[3-hydroxymyristoyl] N-acetylglucosamine deacetylase [Candidatus Aerophobetes bacterium]
MTLDTSPKPKKVSTLGNNQKTLAKAATISGLGLFTGKRVQMTFRPAEENTGIRFQRIDLEDKPILPAQVQYVRGTPRCTVLGKDDVFVQTVEHVLAALSAYEIDNLLIEIDGPEIPICDGSAQPFVDLIEEVGFGYQKTSKKVYHLTSPVFWSQGDVHIVALPSDEFRISYTLNYPNSALLRAQFHTISVNEENFKMEIAPCRTFSLYEETVPLIEQGLIKGGSLENAVIIKGDAILNPEGLRFPDEMVRHKILDLIGDLSLVGCSFFAHVIAIRSGHFSNTAFSKELLNHIMMESS